MNGPIFFGDKFVTTNTFLHINSFFVYKTVICSVDFLIPILLPEYIESVNAIQIMSIVVIPTSITFILTSKFLGMENSRHVLMSRIVSLVLICPFMVILGTTFGIIGIAWAYVIANTGSAVSLVISSYITNQRIK